ncbi:hypothetical protein J3E69DRAFT_366032 [Trichoderma sp. SZMC 28015]
MVTDGRRNSRYLKCDENPAKGIGDRSLCLVPFGKEFLTRYEGQWRRLTKTGLLTLMVHGDNEPVLRDTRIQEASWGITVLDSHPTDVNDLVLHVRRPRPQDLKGPDVPVKIADYESKVDAIWQFRPNARPTNPEVWGMPPDDKETDGMTRVPIPEDIQFRMDLHRALLRGTGFWDVLVRSPDEVDQLAEALAMARLNADTTTDIAEQAKILLPDRLPRLGFGKTTELAVGTLAMTTTLGQIYGTAPTHVATDNFAERLDLISKRVTQRLNQGKANGDTTRARRALVIRGYLPSEEYGAFMNILRDPSIGDEAAAYRRWMPDANWKLRLSLTYWLLKALRILDEEIVAALHEVDSKIVLAVQALMAVEEPVHPAHGLNRPTVNRLGGVTPNARLQVGRANFKGAEFKVEPGGSIAGRQTIPHYLVTMRGNLIAFKKWVLEGFINHDASIDSKPLVNILQQETYHFVVASPDQFLEKHWAQEMPAPFRYPYGEEHSWNDARYDEMLPEIKSKQFPPAVTFDNDNEHVAALTQSQVQDIMWVHKAALEIADIPLRAYFVPARDGPVEECKLFYAIVPLGKAFLEKYEEAWRRLTKDLLLTLNLWDDEQEDVPVAWAARIQQASRGIDVLDCHPSDNNNLVLYVRKPSKEDLKRDPISVKVFSDRTSATVALQNNKEQ